MKKYMKIGHSIYQVVDIAGAIFLAALAAMLVSATWLALDWITRNSISTWAIVCMISGAAVAGIITTIFKDYNK